MFLLFMATNLMYVLDLKIVQSIFFIEYRRKRIEKLSRHLEFFAGCVRRGEKKSEESGFPGSFPNVSK